MSRSLALTQKRASIFNASQQITKALLENCGSAAEIWTKRNCSSTPSFVSCRGKHWCLGLELQKLCLNTTTEILEPGRGRQASGIWAHLRTLLGISGSHSSWPWPYSPTGRQMSQSSWGTNWICSLCLKAQRTGRTQWQSKTSLCTTNGLNQQQALHFSG